MHSSGMSLVQRAVLLQAAMVNICAANWVSFHCISAPSFESEWKTLLLQQFHDVLPGTSINVVYKDAYGALRELMSKLEPIHDLADAKKGRKSVRGIKICSMQRFSTATAHSGRRLLWQMSGYTKLSHSQLHHYRCFRTLSAQDQQLSKMLKH